VVLELEDASGHRGIGEASPLPGFSRETLADCAQALTGIHAHAPNGQGTELPDAPAILAELPAARFAWECAVADLLARRRGCSVASLLGGGSSQRAAVSALLSPGPDMVGEGRAHLARGIRTLKVKVGAEDVAAELAMLVSLRRDLGADFQLRLDANGGWSVAEARVRIEQLAAAQLDIEFIEQPTPPGTLRHLGRCALPWAADESLHDRDEAEALRGAVGCAAFIIKPAALGLRRARELALAAAVNGLGVVVTHLFDGPIGLAAACELALSLPSFVRPCGLDPHVGLSAWPPVELPHFDPLDAGFIHAPRHSGLGFAQEGLPWS
jgi:o-succinylbenzoate synthase